MARLCLTPGTCVEMCIDSSHVVGVHWRHSILVFSGTEQYGIDPQSSFITLKSLHITPPFLKAPKRRDESTKRITQIFNPTNWGSDSLENRD